MSEPVQPAFLARRQQHRAFEASTRMELPRRDGEVTELARTGLVDGHSHIVLGLEQHGSELGFYHLLGDKRQWLIRKVDASLLSTQVAGGFVGATLGIHARRIRSDYYQH